MMENIIQALIKTQSEIEPVKKDKRNPIAKSTYATLDAILEELLPKLNKNGLYLTQIPSMKEDENGNMFLGVETHIYHESGESIKHPVLYMPIEENGRMNVSQSAGSVITYAKRYAISAIFGISTDEDKDGISPNDEKEPMTLEVAKKEKLNFGKYKGNTLLEIIEKDKQYLKWLYSQERTDKRIKEGIKLVSEFVFNKESDEMDANMNELTK